MNDSSVTNFGKEIATQDYIFFTVVCVLEITYPSEKETG